MLCAVSFVLCVVCLTGHGQSHAAPPDAEPLPSLAELEAAGAIIGNIRIGAKNIFDLDDAEENNALFRLANRLHVPTRTPVVESSLLFKRGERISRRKIDDTELGFIVAAAA